MLNPMMIFYNLNSSINKRQNTFKDILLSEMFLYQNVGGLINFIPYVTQLKETFFNWVNLNDNNRSHLKFLVEKNENIGVKPMILALEEWEHLQNNYGAPGVEKEIVVCDKNILQDVMESSSVLNKIILEMMC